MSTERFKKTPSVSPFGLTAPLSGAPRALRAKACANRFLNGIVTGRVRALPYGYKPCALLSGGTAARADSIRPYSPSGELVPSNRPLKHESACVR